MSWIECKLVAGVGSVASFATGNAVVTTLFGFFDTAWVASVSSVVVDMVTCGGSGLVSPGKTRASIVSTCTGATS